MNSPSFPYRIFPLGDAAITIDLGNCIDELVNKEIIARFHQFQMDPLPGTIEVVPAYSSLTIYYDVLYLHKKISPLTSVYEWMKKQLEDRLQLASPAFEAIGHSKKIPVCYDAAFAIDLQHMSDIKKISPEEIIHIHTSKSYKVFMLGFLPGFPYMGEVDERIAMPRKSQPMNVVAGSVGIAGKQTGIYPLTSPGGWQIIGRTPLKLFDASNDKPSLLQAGDTVQFYSISKNDFDEIQNSPLVQERVGMRHESY